MIILIVIHYLKEFRDYEKRGEHFRQLVGVYAERADCSAEAFLKDDAA